MNKAQPHTTYLIDTRLFNVKYLNITSHSSTKINRLWKAFLFIVTKKDINPQNNATYGIRLKSFG